MAVRPSAPPLRGHRLAQVDECGDQGLEVVGGMSRSETIASTRASFRATRTRGQIIVVGQLLAGDRPKVPPAIPPSTQANRRAVRVQTETLFSGTSVGPACAVGPRR